MKKASYFFIVCIILVPFAVSCNLYGPFGSIGSDEDHMEEALKCLHQTPADFDCAIAHYSILSDANTKNQKLCTVYLARAGLTLSALVNNFEAASGGITQAFGSLANSVAPWSTAKQTSLELAVTVAGDDAAADISGVCKTYYDAAVASSDTTLQNYGQLLLALGYFMDCSMRMAKTDQKVCTAAGQVIGDATDITGDNSITQSDIGPATGALSATDTGMCDDEVERCMDDTKLLQGLGLGGADSSFGEIGSAADSLPAELKAAVTAAALEAARSTIRDQISE